MRLLLALLPFFALAAEPKPIRVLVWDEQQPEQVKAYGGKFLGETLAGELAKNKDLEVKSARLADADQGLSDAALDQADVLVFWCHRKVKNQDHARAEAIVRRVQASKLGFIALHSAHWAKPFVRLMQERSKDDALKQLTAEERASAKWVFVNDAPYYKGVKAGAPMTPNVKRDGNNVLVDVTAPESKDLSLFVEGPTPDWALPVPKLVEHAPPGVKRFAFELDGLPPGAKADGAALKLTLVGGDKSYEFNINLN